MDFEGLPLHISKTAAIEYLARSDDALAELNKEEHFKKLQILTNQVIASVQIDLSLAEELSNRADDLVPLLGGDEAKVYGLLAWGFAHPAPEFARERLSAAKEITRIATEHDLTALLPAADILLLVAHLELGEINSIDADVINPTMRFQNLTRIRLIRRFGLVACAQSLMAILTGQTENHKKYSPHRRNRAQMPSPSTPLNRE